LKRRAHLLVSGDEEGSAPTVFTGSRPVRRMGKSRQP
jgi:hypothetical protein